MSDFFTDRLIEFHQIFCDFDVDRQFEDKIRRQIQTIIVNYEAKIDDLTLEMVETLNGKYPSIDSLFTQSSQPDGALLLNQISQYPKIKFAVVLTDQLFKVIDQQKKLPILLKHLIFQIRMPFLRLSLNQLESCLNPKHPALLLIAALLDFIPFWKDEMAVGYPTFNKLSLALAVEETSDQLILTQLNNALAMVQQIKQNQTKRSLIFEKRLLETKDSSHRKKHAQRITGLIVNKLTTKYHPPEFVTTMLNDVWLILLNLEFVRQDDFAFNSAFRAMFTLILSCQDITSQRRLDWLAGSLANLNETLNQGFERLAMNDEVKDAFLAQLELHHIGLMSSANDTITSQPSTDKQALDLVRLQPNNSFGTSIEQTSSKNNKKDSQLTAQDCPKIQPDDSIESFLVGIQEQVLEFPTVQPKQVSINEVNDIFSEPSITEKANNYGKHLKLIGKWFHFLHDNQAHKLIYIEPETGEHLFVDQTSKQSHSIGYLDFEESIKQKQITLFVNLKLSQQAFECTLEKLSIYLQRRQSASEQHLVPELPELPKISELQEGQSRSTTRQNNTLSAVEKALKEQEKQFKNETPSTGSLTPKSNSGTTKIEKEKPNKAFKDIDMRLLAVGSWIKIFRNNKKTKCKLAAKLVSKATYIFVDRQGKKLFELSEKELLDLYANSKIELIEVEMTQQPILAKVISKNRSLKAENMI